METFLGGFVLPSLLFTAATLNWSLISLLDLLAFLLIRFTAPKRGFRSRRRIPLLWSIFIFSLVVILMQLLFLMVWTMEGGKWGFGNAWCFKVIGFMKLESWRTPIVIYFLVVQLFVAFVASVEIRANRYGSLLSYESCWGNLSSFTEYLGSHVRVASCFLLPAIQLLVGISNPSWISLPFFVCSCVGLVDWSLTSNFHGLFRWWRPLWLYASFNICLLYLYQLPISPPLPEIFQSIAEFIGLYKISAKSEWPGICSSISLVLFYLLLSYAKLDLEELDFLLSTREGSLTEQLLPSKHSFFVRESRSGVRHTNVLLGGEVFRMFCINFFTYGFPVSLFALCFWSFHFASICAFGLLVYVGYIIYAFPSLFWLHGLNGLLLVFILLWAVSTYIFNVAFPLVNWRLGNDMEIWEMVGLWHYPIPGLFLLAQFCLGILVALSNLVNNSVLLCLSDEDGQSPGDNCSVEVKEETTVLIVATVAWGLRKCSRAIMLVLIFLIAMKPGFAHAVYIIFFLICLLGHRISKKIRQSMILLCEAHFAILYILQLELISNTLEREGSLSSEILSQLGLLERDSSGDFLEIALLACLCAIHNHGSEMLFSFSAILQHAPCLPVGFSVLKAGLNKSVLMSVYASPGTRNRDIDASYERKIASYLSAIGEKFSSVYRSCGTYIAFLTILVAVYLMKPNYIAFGYIFLLLLWIIGRQLVEMTKRRLWFPLKAYSIVVFMLVYCLSIFPSLEMWLSEVIDLHDWGFSSSDSLLQNVWESLAIMIVMQLYSYERRQSKHTRPDYPDPLIPGIIGFLRRFVIWHSPKILYATMFYAALSPISAFGFLYLIGLVVCSNMPKVSRIPSKSFLVYTGFLVMAEYLFQMWGKQAKMFPGQKNYDLSRFLGLQVFERSFAGLEAGLRGKVLVIAACTLQYNVFHWLQKVPSANQHVGKWEEPCPLFLCVDDSLPVVKMSHGEIKPSQDSNPLSGSRTGMTFNSWLSFNSDSIQSPHDIAAETGLSQANGGRKYTLGYFWGSSDSTKWNKKRILSLRKERFETQITTLKIYLKFWMENMFNLFGLEMSMIALLMASFSLLNVISILYIALLAACILLDRRIVRKLWPMFVLFFACVLVLEYFALWRTILPLSQHSESESSVRCHDCWKSSDLHFSYCRNCWLGLTIDDPRMLISYFLVFMVASFKLHADHNSGFSSSSTYRQVLTQRKNAFVWRDLSFETKGLWTFIDYLRLYCYCHLLDLVLALILITGTLEYDVLHLGYLGFALVFFRMRFQILKKKNKVFKFLRIYNFIVIILSLAYQSPFLGDYNAEKCGTVDYIYEVIGFYKYDYGFRITSRSAIVEIIIFMLVSLQSYMFSSPEFDYVFRYLEAEQIGAIVNEEEKKAAWKKEQLQHIREAEEKKRQRNSQVEKMKSEMLNLQIQLHGMDSNASCGDISPSSEGLRRRSLSLFSTKGGNEKGDIPSKEELNSETDNFFPLEFHELPDIKTEGVESRKNLTRLSYGEITEFEEDASSFSFNIDRENKDKVQGKENPLVSAVHFLGDGVSEIQSLGNQAVSNLVSFLNIPQEDCDSSDQSNGENVVHDEKDNQHVKHTSFDHSSSLISDKTRSISEATSLQLGKILCYIWSQMRSNNDILCYCCFVVVFLWNFSLLSMVYVAALFLYALCVNTGPSYLFWVIMLIYTEAYILLQYLYQIIIHHCGVGFQSDFLYELGFPTDKITSSFVVHTLPLFLVYLFTLIQSSITAKDSEWFSSTEYDLFKKRVSSKKENLTDSSWMEKAREIMMPVTDVVKIMIRSFSIYWKSLTEGTESPPYFVQLSLDVHARPEDGIQPERIESGINQMLSIVHDERCKEKDTSFHHSSSRVHVQSIERSDESSNVVLAVLEVVYASPLKECNSADWHRSLTPAADVAKEILHAKHSGIVEEVGFPYPIFSVIGGGKRDLDLYAYVFGADLAVFFLVSVFYQAVIENKSEFLEVYQLEDQFSKEFVFILMVIFFLIVVDRVIYLCSFAAGRVIFYLFNLVLFTYSVTEYAWNMVSPQREPGVFALRAIYLTKAVSLALQAIQVRNGVPHKSSLYRNFLTSNVSQVNYICYRLYRALPFLYELRCVLDWSCTTTSLTMYDWLKLEDINASLYLVKCDAILNRAKHRQGDKQTKITKFCSGICLFFILICIIWAPMLMYSSGNPTNIANPIKDASVQLDIKTSGGRLTLFQTSLCERWDIDTIFDLDPHGYLDAYDKTDIQIMCCQPDAATYWLVPKVVLNRFTKSMNNTMDITFTWVLNRDRPKNKEVVKYENVVNPWDLPEPTEVQDVLKGINNSFRVHNLYPRYFRVTGSGEIRPLGMEADVVSADLVMHQGNPSWWSFKDTDPLDVTECGGLAGPMAIIVSEETPQGFLGETLSKFSIWGLYISFVLAVGRFIRLQCSDLRMRIPYENLPSCDRLIAICEDIYAARAEGELGVEEVLYWTLIKIYRSPHMLLEYTKID